MSVQRRKDNKGRVLKTGESQRKDGSYMYRYSDVYGTRRTVYASDLKTLREKEDEVEKALEFGIDFSKGEMTVVDYLNQYAAIKKDRKDGTRTGYRSVIVAVEKSPLGTLQLKQVKKITAKQFIIYLSDTGKKYGTIKQYKAVLYSAFEFACDSDILLKNPFKFKLADILENNTLPKDALTQQQVDALLTFVHNDSVYKKYENEILILLGTGLRISELCGLTDKDIDFKNRCIYVNHQLVYNTPVNGHRTLKVTTLKTKSSIRRIPMSTEVMNCFKNVMENRPVIIPEPCIDGYTGFIFLNKKRPQNYHHLERGLVRIVAAYNKKETGLQLPRITPHILRHTFCTNLVNSGLNIKTVQYLMGHAKPDVTLGIYAHKQTTENIRVEFIEALNKSKSNLVFVNYAG